MGLWVIPVYKWYELGKNMAAWWSYLNFSSFSSISSILIGYLKAIVSLITIGSQPCYPHKQCGQSPMHQIQNYNSFSFSFLRYMDDSGCVMFSVIYLTQCTAIIAQGWILQKAKAAADMLNVNSLSFSQSRNSFSEEEDQDLVSTFIQSLLWSDQICDHHHVRLMIAQAFLCRVCSCIEINLLIHLVQISRNWIEINRFLN